MTYVMIDHLAHRESLPGPAQAGERFDEAVHAILPHGGSGQSLWIGREGADADLRIDIDVEVGRAALTWLPDDSTAVELNPGPPITVMWSVDEPLAIVPGALTRVSAETARRAAVEYVTTGERPTCVEWTPASGNS